MLTVDSAVTSTITIDGIAGELSPQDDDTEATFAGLIAAYVNSHSRLGQYVKAIWVPGEATVTLQSKLGFLILGEELEFDHEAGIASPLVEPSITDGGGNLAAGVWKVAYSYETAEGETLVSPAAPITLSMVSGIHVFEAALPVGVIAINYFVSRNADSDVLKFYARSTDGAAFDITQPPIQKARFTPGRNTTPEECMRVMRSYSDRALRQANCARANILMDTFKWPLGSRQKSVNRIDLKFRDAIDDFRPTELRIRDDAHIAKVGKVLPLEVNGAAIDNSHQAYRIALGALAEQRDADFFTQWGADGEALLDQIGWVVCVTDSSSGLVNFPVREEEKSINAPGQISIGLIGRKYATSLYYDDVVERTIPLPTTLSLPRARTEPETEIDMSGGDVTLTPVEANAARVRFTGALTADRTATIPDGVITAAMPDGSDSAGFNRSYVIENATTGAHTLHVVGASGGTPLEIPQGHSTGIKGGGGGFEPIET